MIVANRASKIEARFFAVSLGRPTWNCFFARLRSAKTRRARSNFSKSFVRLWAYGLVRSRMRRSATGRCPSGFYPDFTDTPNKAHAEPMSALGRSAHVGQEQTLVSTSGWAIQWPSILVALAPPSNGISRFPGSLYYRREYIPRMPSIYRPSLAQRPSWLSHTSDIEELILWFRASRDVASVLRKSRTHSTSPILRSSAAKAYPNVPSKFPDSAPPPVFPRGVAPSPQRVLGGPQSLVGKTYTRP